MSSKTDGRSVRRTREVRLPYFDPKSSAEAGVALLVKAGVRFALAGRVAVWLYIPPDRHLYTNDVDFAVPHGEIGRLVKAAADMGHRLTPLAIGGYAFHTPDVSVDFIDRHPELTELFSAAVEAAAKGRFTVPVAGRNVPVVPRDYLIAMTLGTMEDEDERDAAALILTVPRRGYAALRSTVRKYLGPAGALRLDVVARRAGHPVAAKGTRYTK